MMLGGVVYKGTSSSLAFTVEAEVTSIYGMLKALGPATVNRWSSDLGDQFDFDVLVSSTTLGDVDGDGDIDVLAMFNDARLFLNDGLGSFTQAPTSIFDASNVQVGMPVGDATHYWYEYARFYTELLDMDGDGDVDLLTIRLEEKLTVYYNRGASGFGAPVELITGAISFVTGDVNNDGTPDVIAFVASQSAPGTLVLFTNTDTGVLSQDHQSGLGLTSLLDGGVQLADLDAVRLELPPNHATPLGALYPLFLRPLKVHTPWDRIAQGDLGLLKSTQSAPSPSSLQLAHCSSLHFALPLQDGDLDIFVGAGPMNTRSTVNEVYENDGNGRFTKNADSTLATGGDGEMVAQASDQFAIGDINHDGLLDVVLAGPVRGDLLNPGEDPLQVPRREVRLGGRMPTIVKSPTATSALGLALISDAISLGGSSAADMAAVDVAAGDVDGDGDVDLILTRAVNKSPFYRYSAVVVLNTDAMGDGHYEMLQGGAIDHVMSIGAVADFNKGISQRASTSLWLPPHHPGSRSPLVDSRAGMPCVAPVCGRRCARSADDSRRQKRRWSICRRRRRARRNLLQRRRRDDGEQWASPRRISQHRLSSLHENILYCELLARRRSQW